MKVMISMFLTALVFHASAQDVKLHESYISRKTIALGFTQLGIGATTLNNMLELSGYHALEPSVGAITISVSSDFGPAWGVFYGTDLGIISHAQSSNKYQRFQYYRFYGGVEYTALKQQRFELLGRLALSYSDATLRLYDAVADTTSFTHYLAGTADAKRVQIGRWGIDVGIQSRFRILDNAFIGLGAGYILALGSNDWKHDAGHFEGAPHTALGSWYVGTRIGGLFHRQVKRIRAQEFEQGDKPAHIVMPNPL